MALEDAQSCRALHSVAAALLIAAALPLGACSSWSGHGEIEVSAAHEYSIDQPVDLLQIDNKIGDVTAVSDPNAEGITAEITVTGFGHTEDHALESLERVDVAFGHQRRSGMEAAFGGVTVPKNFFGRNGHGYRVRWTVTAPPGVELELDTEVGDIDVGSFDAGARLFTEVGDIRLASIGGDLRAETEVGDVRADNVDGRVRASTEVGDIRVRAFGPVHASSEVGDVRVVLLGGSIEDVTASSEVGSLWLYLPTEVRGSIDAETSTGSVRERIGSGTEINVMRDRKGVYKATIGGGGDSEFHLRTDVGSIVIASAERLTRD